MASLSIKWWQDMYSETLTLLVSNRLGIDMQIGKALVFGLLIQSLNTSSVHQRRRGPTSVLMFLNKAHISWNWYIFTGLFGKTIKYASLWKSLRGTRHGLKLQNLDQDFRYPKAWQCLDQWICFSSHINENSLLPFWGASGATSVPRSSAGLCRTTATSEAERTEATGSGRGSLPGEFDPLGSPLGSGDTDDPDFLHYLICFWACLHGKMLYQSMVQYEFRLL